MSLSKNIKFCNLIAKKISETDSFPVFICYLLRLSGVSNKDCAKIVNNTKNLTNFVIAFTTKNYLKEHNLETLEFHGDAFANAAVTEFVWDKFDTLKVLEYKDTITKILKSKYTFSQFGKFLHFEKFVKNGGEKNKINMDVYEDTFEAYIAALYMSTKILPMNRGSGFQYVRTFVYNLLNKFNYGSQLDVEKILLLNTVTLIKNLFFDKYFTVDFINANSDPFIYTTKDKVFTAKIRIKVNDTGDDDVDYVILEDTASSDMKKQKAKNNAAKQFYFKYLKSPKNPKDLIDTFDLADKYIKKEEEVEEEIEFEEDLEEEESMKEFLEEGPEFLGEDIEEGEGVPEDLEDLFAAADIDIDIEGMEE